MGILCLGAFYVCPSTIRLTLVAGHLNAVKALAERVPCNHLVHPDLVQSDEGAEGAVSQHAIEYAQHTALWELFASFDRWEEFALQYMSAHHSRRDRLAEKQFKNEAKSALNDFISRAKAMVLKDEEGLSSVLDDVVRLEDPESYMALSRIRDLYIPEIILRMHEVYLWGGENIDVSYYPT
jgi:Nuclear pore protein 84 / 107